MLMTQNTKFHFWFGGVPFYIAIFATVPEFVNKLTCVQRTLNHWTKVSEAGESVKGKTKGEVRASEIKQSWVGRSNSGGPVQLLLSHPDSECVKCIVQPLDKTVGGRVTHKKKK